MRPIADWRIPIRLNETTRAYFERLAAISPPEEAQRYMDIHHSANDTFDKVHIRELQLGAGCMAAMIYLETARRNYGLAAEAASRFFTSLSEYSGQVADPQLKKRLEEILGLRDSITAGLAKGEPAVLSGLESLLLQTQQKAQP